jgi:hypothetical protein
VSSDPIVLYGLVQTLDRFPRGARSPTTCDLLWYGKPGPLVGRTSYGDICLCQEGLTQCQRDHDDYACSYGRGVVSGDDRIEPSTRMPICQVRVSASSYVLSCHALNGTAFHGFDCNGVYPVLEIPRA